MKTLLSLLFISLFSFQAMAQASKRLQEFNLEGGLAIQGYDPVAYFVAGKAIKGKKEFSVLFDGVKYNFSSPANKEAFLKNPRKYEPQYGGWCAYAMGATQEKVSIDPETFKILEGKLYLFYHSWTNNTLTKWNKDEKVLKANADKFWQKTGL